VGIKVDPEGQTNSCLFCLRPKCFCASLVVLVRFDFFQFFFTTPQFVRLSPDLITRLNIITVKQGILICYFGVIFNL